ncbi:helix-turn-helix transcriptional regulator [Humitalea sp. 24SJ18S-53]|uniref:helix-turn-helix transcriptional regulator n=1 Tax=Humitalea sp. 24SJ18S-53 TaxID=3422307 RepID=UPI003D67746B
MQIQPMPLGGLAAGMLQGGVPALIDSVGRAGFPACLFGLARQAIGADHVTAFAFDRTGRPSVILAENAGPTAVAHQVARRYVDRYWTMDPLHERQPAGPCLVEIDAADVTHADYRTDCYTAVHLGARLSVCDSRPGGALRLNFYRARRFTPAEIGAVVGSMALLMPLLWRQAAEVRSLPRAESFAARVAATFPTMPRRERDVCALIAAGVGSEGIALELGISRNTVLTYRKRAYARLSISSQNELLRLLLAAGR